MSSRDLLGLLEKASRPFPLLFSAASCITILTVKRMARCGVTVSAAVPTCISGTAPASAALAKLAVDGVEAHRSPGPGPAPAQPQRHREAATEPYPRERPASASLPDRACVRAPNYGCIMPVTTYRDARPAGKSDCFRSQWYAAIEAFPLEDVQPNEK